MVVFSSLPLTAQSVVFPGSALSTFWIARANRLQPCPGKHCRADQPNTHRCGHTQDPKGEKIPSNPGVGIIESTTMTSCDTKDDDVNATRGTGSSQPSQAWYSYCCPQVTRRLSRSLRAARSIASGS